MPNGATDVTWAKLITIGLPVLLAVAPVIFIALEIRGRYEEHLGRPHEGAELKFNDIYQRMSTLEEQIRSIRREQANRRESGGR